MGFPEGYPDWAQRLTANPALPGFFAFDPSSEKVQALLGLGFRFRMHPIPEISKHSAEHLARVLSDISSLATDDLALAI